MRPEDYNPVQSAANKERNANLFTKVAVDPRVPREAIFEFKHMAEDPQALAYWVHEDAPRAIEFLQGIAYAGESGVISRELMSDLISKTLLSPGSLHAICEGRRANEAIDLIDRINVNEREKLYLSPDEQVIGILGSRTSDSGRQKIFGHLSIMDRETKLQAYQLKDGMPALIMYGMVDDVLADIKRFGHEHKVQAMTPAVITALVAKGKTAEAVTLIGGFTNDEIGGILSKPHVVSTLAVGAPGQMLAIVQGLEPETQKSVLLADRAAGGLCGNGQMAIVQEMQRKHGLPEIKPVVAYPRYGA